jgi:hypothetical protein
LVVVPDEAIDPPGVRPAVEGYEGAVPVPPALMPDDGELVAEPA